MAFATKYKTTIKNWEGDTITAEIQEDAFAGTVQEFTPIGGNPIVIEHQCNVNIKESYIVPSQARIAVYVNYDWDLVELLYATDRQFKLVIKNGSKHLFNGWIIAGVNSEEYYTGRYVVTLQATDGLPDLKNIQYLDSGALYDEFQKPLTVLQNCLAETGLSLTFYENNDIYAAAGMSTTSADSPLDQSYIHTKSYGADIDDVLSCWDVLEKIAQAFHCRIMQTPDTANTMSWFMSKLDVIGDNTTYRLYLANGTYVTTQAITPLLTMGTDVNHVNGRAQIGIQQAYKEVNLTLERGQEYQLIKGQNFEDADFPTASTLTNWQSLSDLDLTGTWGGATIAKETKDGNTVANLNAYSSTPTSGAGTQSGANVTIAKTLHGLATTDWIMIAEGSYIGIFKVVTVTDVNNFVINATYTVDETIGYAPCTAGTGIETNFEFPLGNDVPLVDRDGDRLKIDLEYYYEPNGSHTNDSPFKSIAVIIHADDGANPKTVDHNGIWQLVGTTIIRPIIIPIDTTNTDKVTFSLEASMSSDNGFYTSGSPTIHVGILTGQFQATYSSDYMFNLVKLSMVGGATKTNTTAIDSDYVDSLALDMFHGDGDSTDNEEWKYLRPILDDATPKRNINSWQQDGGTADNLEDIIESNLAAAYDKNSQIWSGTLQGTIEPLNAIDDPLNFDRVFQIQRLSRNLTNNFNSVSMIEIDPEGEPTFGLSISASSYVEFDMPIPSGGGGFESVANRFATITNTGNAQVSLSATITGDDTSYFSIVGQTEFTLDVGKTHIIEVACLQNQTEGAYVSSIIVAETRAYRTMTQKTIKLGHINKAETTVYMNNGVFDGDISAALSGATVTTNTTGSTPNPAAVQIDSMFVTSDIFWSVITSGGSGSRPCYLKNGAVTLASATLTAPNASININPNLYSYAQAGTWDGEDLDYTLV